MSERTAFIFNIQKYNMYDGPGVRTLVFFKGCPLRCQWCSNPEGQPRQYQIMLKREQCTSCGSCMRICPAGLHTTDAGGLHIVDRGRECVGCGRCVEACPSNALALSGEQRTISSLMEVIEEDRPFYETSGGGLTVSGGEALMQPEALINLLESCHQRFINTAVETCGYAPHEVLVKVAPHVDLFLFDLKHMDTDRHKMLTGVHNDRILDNLIWLLETRHNVKVRMPLLRGVNDDEEEIAQVIDLLRPYREQANFKGMDLLPYHKLGVHKYAQLDIPYEIKKDPTLPFEDLNRLKIFIEKRNFPGAIIRH